MSEAVMEAPDANDPGPSPPNWDAIQEEIHCPLCEYNLRGLSAPRCPECGYTFVWAELLEIDRRLHPYLFEHHPERPYWSFVKTIIGGLQPWKFWKSLHPAQPCRPGRLINYAAWLLVPLILPWIALLGDPIALRLNKNARYRQWEQAYLTNPETASNFKDELKVFGGINGYLDAHYPVSILGVFGQLGAPRQVILMYAKPAILALAWLITTLVALFIFEISRRGVKIGRIHIVRTVVYSADLIWWLGLMLILIALLSITAAIGLKLNNSAFVEPEFFLQKVAGAAVIAFGIRLTFAYRRYLRFPHAVWVVLSSQIIAGLIVFKLALDLSLIR
ncbi:hypothetical protein B7486_12340 [cyanobacterium TDX16]|nr:hypothetical protein B7486_12340 [cyanobacterium TDX16]